MRLFATLTAAPLVALSGATADPPRPVPDLPAGAVEYQPEKFTQEIAITNGLHRISRRPIKGMSNTDWHQSGGVRGLPFVTSRKFRTLPPGTEPTYALAAVPVLNQFGYHQHNTALTRTYPVGTRFDDVLSFGSVVFEHRVREKTAAGWRSRVEFRDPDRYPPGYKPVSIMQCNKCHNRVQSGEYAAALVPGSDFVFSDPMRWEVARGVQWYDP